MSTTSMQKKTRGNTRKAVDYELYGALGSKKYKNNMAAGTDRVAALRCDLATPDEYVERAEALAEANGRKIETRSFVQSFSNEELDPGNPADVQRVNDLGYEWAKRMHPDSDVLVITHTDGHGGHPHNHIKVMNHDNVTGKGLRWGDMYFQYQRVNDELMREHGLSVVEKNVERVDPSLLWEQRRGNESLPEFDRELGDRIEEALLDERVVDRASFESALDDRGIELHEKTYTIKASADGTKPARESVGWTYAMRDETCPKPRMRRRKASTLSEEFTAKGVEEILAEKERMARDEQARVDDEQAARAARRARERVIGIDDLPEVERGDGGRPGGDGPELGEDRPVPGGRGERREPAEDRVGADPALDAAVRRLEESRRQREEARRDTGDPGHAGQGDCTDGRNAHPDRGGQASQRGERRTKRARRIAAHQEHQRAAEGGGRGLE